MNHLSSLVISLIKFYQLILSPVFSSLSPGLGCRFSPTCSQVTIQGIIKFGLIRGLRLGLNQFSHCHPFYKHD